MKNIDSVCSVAVKVTRPKSTFYASDSKTTKKKKTFDKVSRKSLITTQPKDLRDNQPYTLKPINSVDFLSFTIFVKKHCANQKKAYKNVKLIQHYKIKSNNIRSRLSTPDHDDNKNLKMRDTIYYGLLGRNTNAHYVPQFKSLRFEIKDRLKVKQEIGYIRDCILNVEENNKIEKYNYTYSIENYKSQVKQWHEFLAKDYQKSMVCLQKCDDVMIELNKVLSLRETLASKEFAIQCRLIELDHLYFMEQKYGRFLYYLSPPSWRAKHRDFARSVEIEAKGFDLGSSSEEDTFNIIFKKMHNECLLGLVKPVLYFTNPQMLMSLFERIESQHFHHFIHVLSLIPHAKVLKKRCALLKRGIEKDSAMSTLLLEDFIKHLHFCEERETLLQTKFLKVLNGLFYDSVAATDVLKLKMSLKYNFELWNKEQNLDLNTTYAAKGLEAAYIDFSFKLEGFTNDTVKSAVDRYIQKEINKIKNANIAARELRMFDRLQHSLQKTFEKKIVIPKSKSVVLKKLLSNKKINQSVKHGLKSSSKQIKLTEAEVEYLRLFTEWTNTDDPAKFLHSFSVAGTGINKLSM